MDYAKDPNHDVIKRLCVTLSLFQDKNMYCGYSLELPQQDASNE